MGFSNQQFLVPDHPFKAFLHLTKAYHGRLLLMLIAPMLIALGSTLMPFQIKGLIDRVTAMNGSDDIHSWLFWQPVILFVLLSEMINLAYRSFDLMVIRYMIPLRSEIRNKCFTYLLGHSYGYAQDHLTGELGNKILDMGNSVIKLFQMIAIPMFSTVLMVLFGIGIVAAIHPLSALIMAVWSCFFIGCSLFSIHKVRYYSEIFSRANSRYMGKLIDSAANLITIKLFARESAELDNIQLPQQDYMDKNATMNLYITKIRWVLGFSVTLFQAVVLYYLVQSWQNGTVSVGSIAFIMSMSLTITSHLFDMASRLMEFFEQLGTFKQSLSILHQPHGVKDQENAASLTVTAGKIEYDTVGFAYHGSNRIFNQQNIIIHPKEKIGIVGYSGAGKSSFVHLLLRFFDLHEGEIRIDGQNIASVTQQSLREHISFIPQDPVLFHQSLMENIRYGCLNATDQEIMQAAKQAHAHDFIMELPDQYQTIVGERGLKLSGGQRQRVAIARAIIKKAPIMILDEATSSLDSVTEAAIQEGLYPLMEQATTIVIAHRLSTIAQMDRILVLHQGEVVEQGTHQELLEKNGHYSAIWQRQAGGFLAV